MKGEWKEMNRIKGRLLVALIILGVVFVWTGMSDVVDSKKTPTDFASIDGNAMHVGDIVEGDLAGNLGAFEEMYHTTYGIKTGSSDYVYLVPVGSKYIGLKSITKEQVAELDAQANETVDYILGNSKIEPRTVHFKGKVTQMGNDEQYYAKDYMKQMGLNDSEISQTLSNYMIVSVDFDHGMMFVGIGALCIVGALLLLVPQIGAVTQNIGHKKRMKELEAMPASRSAVQNDYYDAGTSNLQDQPLVMKKDPFEEARQDTDMTSGNSVFKLSGEENLQNNNQRNPWDVPDKVNDNEQNDKKESSSGLKLKM